MEFPTPEWIAWFNTQRLLEPIGFIPRDEAEANCYRQFANPAGPRAA